MNKLTIALVLLVACGATVSAENNFAEQKSVGVMNGKNVITHYTTGPLTEEASQAVLRLMKQLKKSANGLFNWLNVGNCQEIRKQLSKNYKLSDVTTIEQLLKADAFVVTSNDHAIFLVRKEYREILEEVFEMEVVGGEESVCLPGCFEEVKAFMEDLGACYENERMLNLEQNKLNVLRSECKNLQEIQEGLIFEIEEVKNQLESID